MEPQQHNQRFADPGDTIYSLMADEVLVECPRCGKCASHKPITCESARRDWFAPRRLVCPHCALTRDWNEAGIHRCWRESPPRDDYFNEVLWIRGACGSNEIWAYNWRHLELIEKYVAAKLRQHVRDSQFGWANKSFVNRLPRWITSAKNRDDVLATIARMKRERQSGT
ncbi:MAG TPA: hypothetical protein VMP01_22665 [Pirellulaceae bacterium]|nr:hypothetical protein [Pirellulaceae bacterium]